MAGSGRCVSAGDSAQTYTLSQEQPHQWKIAIVDLQDVRY